MKVLVSRPDYFTVSYKLPDNHWMNPDNKPNPRRVKRQWSRLVGFYRNLGVEVVVEPPASPELPDFCFVANAGLICGRKIVLSNFRYPERQPEREFNEEYFRVLLPDFEILRLHPEFYFEGQGDGLWVGDQLLLGHGFRTSCETAPELKRLLGREVVPLKLVEPIKGKIFYHLDTCLLYLEELKLFLAAKQAFHPSAWQKIHQIADVMDINEIDSRAGEELFLNSVIVDNFILTPYLSGSIEKFLDDQGYAPIFIDMSEFKKSGGAVRCLTLQISAG